jgi:hypothetical protein
MTAARTHPMPTSLPRRLEPETLDHLAPDDPRAVRSRRDLQRINRIMGAAGILGGVLVRRQPAPRRIIELGAGDGSLMLRMARRFCADWTNVELTLLDRHDLVSGDTRDRFSALGWSLQVMCVDVMDWITQPAQQRSDIVIANLFIHHFAPDQIRDLFAALARRTDMFVACEPRRARLPLLASHLVGLLGANEITRQDAVLSVRAGFSHTELSRLWPADPGWHLQERPACLFSHLFTATRRPG